MTRALPVLALVALVGAVACGPAEVPVPDLEREPVKVLVEGPEEVWRPLLAQVAGWEGIEVEPVFAAPTSAPAPIPDPPPDLVLAADLARIGEIVATTRPVRLPLSLVAAVPPSLTGGGDRPWVAVAARAWTVVFDPASVAEGDLPEAVADLADPRFAGRLGTVEGSRSLAVRLAEVAALEGPELATALQEALQPGSTFADPDALVAAVREGAVDFAVLDHDEALRAGAGSGLRLQLLEAGSGPVIDVTGALVLQDGAEVRRILELLLGSEAQALLVDATRAYPVRDDVAPPAGAPPLPTVALPAPAAVAAALGAG